MDFLTQIIKNGCSIKCYFDDLENYPNRIGFQLTTPHNLDLYPSQDEIDNDFWLLFSIFGLKILENISDPFTYNIEESYGAILINNVRYEINLPNDIASLFKINEHQHLNNYSFDLIHNRIIDLILEKIDHNLELKTIYYNLIIQEGPEHYIKNYVDSDNSDNSDNSDDDNSSENYSGYSIGFAKILKSYNENAF
jgi:hypothetical protein